MKNAMNRVNNLGAILAAGLLGSALLCACSGKKEVTPPPPEKVVPAAKGDATRDDAIKPPPAAEESGTPVAAGSPDGGVQGQLTLKPVPSAPFEKIDTPLGGLWKKTDQPGLGLQIEIGKQGDMTVALIRSTPVVDEAAIAFHGLGGKVKPEGAKKKAECYAKRFKVDDVWAQEIVSTTTDTWTAGRNDHVIRQPDCAILAFKEAHLSLSLAQNVLTVKQEDQPVGTFQKVVVKK